MKHTRLIIGFGCALVLVLGLSAGCGKVADEATEKTIEAGLAKDGEKVDVQVDRDGETMRIATEEGEMVISGDDASLSMTTESGEMRIQAGDGTELPADFPKDVPLPNGFALETVQTMTENNTFTVSGSAEGSATDVATNLRNAIGRQGWAETQNYSQAGVMEQASYEKDGRSLTIMVIGEGGKTTVSIIVADQ